MNHLYKVTGCGISAICEQSSQGMLWIIERILHKGGVPVITPWAEEQDIEEKS